ncbi:MAG: hypothetical protein R3E97_06730 [Candidatus Eisenbacteria bacterium]
MDRFLAFLERLMSIDRRWLYLAVAIAVAVPVLRPIGLPVKVSNETRDFFAQLEALHEGDVILFSFDYEADTNAELDPMSRVIWDYCFSRGIRIVALTLYPGGVGIAENIMNEAAEKYGKEYGVDYVFLGFNADWSGTMLRMGESFRLTYPAEQYGKATTEIPLLDDADKYADVPLLVSIASSSYAEYWAIWAGGKFGQKIVTGNTAVQAVLVYPYYQAGQILGFLGGLKGAAELETLTDLPGDATRGMDSQSTGHGLMVLFILLGNLAYLAQKIRQRRAV